MFDKDYTLNLVNQVIKSEIIPSITNSKAKEQAIALISVLRNVSVNTVQYLKPYLEVNELLNIELTVLFDQMSRDMKIKESDLLRRVNEYQNELERINAISDIKNQWEALNQLMSHVIKSLYERYDITAAYIAKCRELLRKQLNIEMRLVS